MNTIHKNLRESSILLGELDSYKPRKGILIDGGHTSRAMVDPKTDKTIDGGPSNAWVKLDAGEDTQTVVLAIRELVLAVNSKVNFWDADNPSFINGYMFNGSSQHLMNPDTVDEVVKIKRMFGDIDVIVPKDKLSVLDTFLDNEMDDGEVEWEITDKNKLTDDWYYVGRPKSYAKLPDQTVTLWYYKPRNQIVQLDFEGDVMCKIYQNTSKSYTTPSSWIKFSKSSPMEDLEHDIKGLSHKIMLRALARSVFRLGLVVTLTPTGKPSGSKRHRMPSEYTFNPAGEQGGLRKAYERAGVHRVKGMEVPAYKFIEAKDAKAVHGDKAYIKDLPTVFKMMFGVDEATDDDMKRFESFVGLISLIKEGHENGRITSDTVNTLSTYFISLMKDQSGISISEITSPVLYMKRELSSITS